MPKLYLVPTPVGNLQDMTPRSVKVLSEADLIIAEDTRTSGKLLKYFDVKTHMISHHMHNEHKTLSSLIERLKSGQSIAVITDAGTPGISDPGFLIAREAIREGIEVECLPGATAFVPALAASGLPCDRFTFEGFLPVKKGRSTRFAELAEEQRTMIFYESPHKLLKTLEDMAVAFGEDRPMSVSREISKMFEQHVRGSVKDILEHFKAKAPKGEFVIVVQGCEPKKEKKRKINKYD